jgi:hypothetical protein
MTFNSIDEIIDILKSLKNVPKWVVKARDYQRETVAIMYGDGYTDLITQIEHIEDSKRAASRAKYSRSVKDSISKILNPIDNVFSANGGIKKYYLEGERKKTFINIISNIRDGLSLEQWLHRFWAKDLYNIDPSGLMMLERDNKGEMYPTYKSINCIRYYSERGLNVNFVIFEPTKGENNTLIWRIVDDTYDYIIRQDNEIFAEVTDRRIAHLFGTCPCRIISDKTQMGELIRLAFIDSIIEIYKEVLRDRSILIAHKFLNGFCIPYLPEIICPKCHGTKKNGIDSCDACNGTGIILKPDVLSKITIPIDLNSDNPVQLPSNFAGFISPDLAIWDQYIKEEKRLTNEAFEVIWGTRESEIKDQTAMAVILNTQPMIAKLNSISDVVQSHEQAFTEMIANGLGYSREGKRVSEIAYGRDYIVQPPEFLLKEYQLSNEKNDPIAIRDRKLTEYLTSKYKNDPQSLHIELLKKDLEPYVHFDLKTIKEIYGIGEAQKKGLFTDWWESLKETDKLKTKEQLEALRDKWYNSKIMVNINNNVNLNPIENEQE